MRIQYKDDEQTLVTMTCNKDFEDALRCVEPIPNYDDAYRLTIRIDDSLTPTRKSPAKKKPCIIIKDGLSTKTTSAKAKSFRIREIWVLTFSSIIFEILM